ncbi:DUF2796 domain-containing protein [Stutzerimonas azotifigens]|uniref:DUF2796 domain-containing protein n=1 Tax=Stutzerimonas azotifigens TaxID=291995 RepID=A0ABR5Z641_9GAMM|nr:DUF2796 domain-containing protein [Stutzerimonas azotifigens]MBA1275587.1 DUF2796 domain-containing protein [Stutzerimonas azotifigens]
MRRLLLALPFALIPLAHAAEHSHDHDHDHEHGSLSAHEHGVARLNVALDGQALELELESPAMNLVGFEHAATSDADKATLKAARESLEQPLTLFSLPAQAGCSVASTELESPLFGRKEHSHEHTKEHGHTHAEEHGHGDHDHEHSDISAHYQLSCFTPAALKTLDLNALFQRFPDTRTIQVQLIGPSGQQGVELTPSNPRLNF